MTEKQIRQLNLIFPTSIQPYQIPLFRGAVHRKVEAKYDRYHNHTETGLLNRYPLIQYKIRHHDQQLQPMIMFIGGETVLDAMAILSADNFNFQLNGEQHYVKNLIIEPSQVLLIQEATDCFSYSIHQYFALNQAQYVMFKQANSLVEKIQLLEERVKYHIEGFVKKIDWSLDAPLQVSISSMIREKWISFKRQKVLVFSFDFKTNVKLPDFLGLGKGSAYSGLGVVRQKALAAKIAPAPTRRRRRLRGS